MYRMEPCNRLDHLLPWFRTGLGKLHSGSTRTVGLFLTMPSLDPQSTSTSLLQQVQSGDDLAWFRLVSSYTPLIESWTRQQGIRRSDSEDIIQNVFLAVAQHIREFGRVQVSNSFRAWLWTITRSKIIDHVRSSKKRPNSIAGDYMGTIQAPDRLAEARSASDTKDDLNTLVGTALEIIRLDFSQQTWTAFWQTCALGRPPSEVAQEMGMTAAAVCMCRARIMRRLRETIDPS